MKNIKIIFSFAILSLLLSSCSPSLSPFTQRLYEENNWTESELRRIQFYLSEDIVLHRALKGVSSEIVEGQIKMRDGRKVEKVVIRKGTPGVLLFVPKENRFAVSFEEGANSKFLMFGPNPKARNRYILLASEWTNRKGKITYGDEKYWVEASPNLAGLMVDLSRANSVSVKSRAASGRKIGE